MVPADPEALMGELTKLRHATKARDDGAADLHAENMMIIEELLEWPGDVALASLGELRRSMKFMPALADILDVCRERGRYRRNIHRCFMAAARRVVENQKVVAIHAVR